MQLRLQLSPAMDPYPPTVQLKLSIHNAIGSLVRSMHVTGGRMYLEEQLFSDNSLLRTRSYRFIDRQHLIPLIATRLESSFHERTHFNAD